MTKQEAEAEARELVKGWGNRMKREECNHAEAFCLMIYQCKDCGRHVKIWNSRDGVTPFTVGCIQDGCGGTMQHICWNLDCFCPEHRAEIGDPVFVDASADAMNRRDEKDARNLWENETKGVGLRKTFASFDEFFNQIKKENQCYSKNGGPMLIFHGAE